MKKINILLFILIVLVSKYSSAQSFSIVGSDIQPTPHLNSWDDSLGNTFIWTLPQNGFYNKYFNPKYLWIEKIVHSYDGKRFDTLSQLIVPSISGQKYFTPYCICNIGQKLYAFSIVVVNDVKNDLFADEINPINLQLIGKPVKIFEYNHAKAKRMVDPATASYREFGLTGYLYMKQSEDKSKVLFCVDECPNNNNKHIVHCIVFNGNILEPFWERKDTAALLKYPVLGNNGVFITSISMQRFKGPGSDKLFPKGCNTYIGIITIDKNKKMIRDIFVKDYYLPDFKATFKSDNSIIGCGFFSYSGNTLGQNGPAEGAYCISFKPDSEKCSIEKGFDFKNLYPEENKPSFKNYELRDVLTSEEGNTWIVGEYCFGIGLNQKYGNVLIGSLNKKDSLVGLQDISKEINSTNDGLFASPRATFATQVIEGNLVCLFSDESNVFIFPVTPEGKISNDKTISCRGKISPSSDPFFCTSIRKNEFYILCEPAEEGEHNSVGRIQL